MSERISFWLIPAEPDKQRLQQAICELAARFDGPVFEPHVTIYSGSMENPNDAARILQIITGDFPQALRTCGVAHSEQFTKTLFIELGVDPRIDRMSGELKALSASRDDYELKPHLSLLYAALAPEIRQSLARELVVPEVIRFDSVQAVATGADTQTKCDVETWRTIAERTLA